MQAAEEAEGGRQLGCQSASRLHCPRRSSVIPALQLSTMGVPILQGTLKFSEVLGDWPKISQLLSNRAEIRPRPGGC